MKTLFLVRHGKAEIRNTEIPDIKRSLTERGIHDSSLMAKRLKQKTKPSLLITSPAVRAHQTARIFAKELGYNTRNIRTRKAIYEGAVDDLLSTIQDIDDTHDTIIMFGHNPSIEDFAWYLVKGFRKRVPTCGLAGIECNIKTWRDLSRGRGKLKLLEYPGKIKKSESKKILRKSIEEKLSEQTKSILEEIDPEATGKIEKSLKQSCKMIAKEFVKLQQKPKK